MSVLSFLSRRSFWRCRAELVGVMRNIAMMAVALLALSLASPAASGVVAAPSPSPTEQAPAFAFTAWHVAELTTPGNPTAKPDADDVDAISLIFGEGSAVMVETANQCATASGTIALHEDGSVVANLATSTGRASACERRSPEERFLNLVNLATTWQLDGANLTLTLMDGGTIVLVQSIVGTTWQWTEFQSGNGELVTPEAGDATTLVFGSDGMLTLTTPCITLTAPYMLDGPSGLRIDTSAIPESAKPCEQGPRLALEAMRSYVFQDAHLWISLMADGGIYGFVATEAHG